MKYLIILLVILTSCISHTKETFYPHKMNATILLQPTENTLKSVVHILYTAEADKVYGDRLTFPYIFDASIVETKYGVNVYSGNVLAFSIMPIDECEYIVTVYNSNLSVCSYTTECFFFDTFSAENKI